MCSGTSVLAGDDIYDAWLYAGEMNPAPYLAESVELELAP